MPPAAVTLLSTAPSPITALSWRNETDLVGGTAAGQVVEWTRATTVSLLDVRPGISVRSVEAAHNPDALLLSFADRAVVRFDRVRCEAREVWTPELDDLDFVHLSWSQSGTPEVFGTRLACAYQYTSSVYTGQLQRIWEISILDVGENTTLWRYADMREDVATCAALLARGTATAIGTSDGHVVLSSPWFPPGSVSQHVFDEPVLRMAAARVGAPFSAEYAAIGRSNVFTHGPMGDSRWIRTGEEPTSAIVSRDASRLAIGDVDGTVRVHDFTTGQELASAQLGAPVGNLEFSPSGEQLACAAVGTRRPWCLRLPSASSMKGTKGGFLARAVARLRTRKASPA